MMFHQDYHAFGEEVCRIRFADDLEPVTAFDCFGNVSFAVTVGTKPTERDSIHAESWPLNSNVGRSSYRLVGGLLERNWIPLISLDQIQDGALLVQYLKCQLNGLAFDVALMQAHTDRLDPQLLTTQCPPFSGAS